MNSFLRTLDIGTCCSMPSSSQLSLRCCNMLRISREIMEIAVPGPIRLMRTSSGPNTFSEYRSPDAASDSAKEAEQYVSISCRRARVNEASAERSTKNTWHWETSETKLSSPSTNGLNAANITEEVKLRTRPTIICEALSGKHQVSMPVMHSLRRHSAISKYMQRGV